MDGFPSLHFHDERNHDEFDDERYLRALERLANRAHSPQLEQICRDLHEAERIRLHRTNGDSSVDGRNP